MTSAEVMKTHKNKREIAMVTWMFSEISVLRWWLDVEVNCSLPECYAEEFYP